MKINIIKAALLSAVVALASCNPGKTVTPQSQQEEAMKVITEIDSMKKTVEPQSETKTIEGKIQTIANGKDGYMALVQTTDKTTYFATISRANLTTPEQYKTFEVGETVKLSGDSWKMNNENHLTVREIVQ
ncbi:MAG TPA: hypothetical protein VK476_04450 [Flavobacterium sp.]|nr:hypothetical protein [Flavobacterium sp.]